MSEIRMCECERCKAGNPPVGPVEYGKCHDGCGAQTSIATHTRTASGRKKGLPCLFLPGHGRLSSWIVNRRIDERPSREKLEDLYRSGMSTYEIAEVVSRLNGRKIHGSTICRWLNDLGIPVRDISARSRLRNLRHKDTYRDVSLSGKDARRASVEFRRPVDPVKKRVLMRRATRAWQAKCVANRVLWECENPGCQEQRVLKRSEAKIRRFCSHSCSAKVVNHEKKIARLFRELANVPLRVRPDWLTDEEWARLQENTSA